MRKIAIALPKDDPARKVLADTAGRHADAALPHFSSGDYAGNTWLASFAVNCSRSQRRIYGKLDHGKKGRDLYGPLNLERIAGAGTVSVPFFPHSRGQGGEFGNVPWPRREKATGGDHRPRP
jgi:hypothetical protein